MNDPLPPPPLPADVTDDADPARRDVRLLDRCTPVNEPLLRSGMLMPLLAPFPLPRLLSALLRPAPPPLLGAAPSARPVEMRLRRLAEPDVASRSLGDDPFCTACWGTHGHGEPPVPSRETHCECARDIVELSADPSTPCTCRGDQSIRPCCLSYLQVPLKR